MNNTLLQPEDSKRVADAIIAAIHSPDGNLNLRAGLSRALHASNAAGSELFADRLTRAIRTGLSEIKVPKL